MNELTEDVISSSKATCIFPALVFLLAVLLLLKSAVVIFAPLKSHLLPTILTKIGRLFSHVKMVVSALMGQTPLTPDDKLIARGLRILAPTQINPNISEPFGTPAPPNAAHDSHAQSLIIGEAFAIFFILLFTSSRLFVRRYRTKFWGLDDWLVIPAAVRLHRLRE